MDDGWVTETLGSSEAVSNRPGALLRGHSTMTPVAMANKKREFDPNTFLATIGAGRKILAVPKKRSIFTQGEVADAVFYLRKGKVRLTVVSKGGKEATIGILNEGNFFGEG